MADFLEDHNNLISTTCGYGPSSLFKQQQSPGPAKRFGLSALHQLKTDEGRSKRAMRLAQERTSVVHLCG